MIHNQNSSALLLFAVLVVTCISTKTHAFVPWVNTQRGWHNTALKYSEAVQVPLPPAFEDRMRKILQEKQKPKTRKTNVEEVTTMEEYKTVVANEKDRMVVVRFYAPWCRACKASAPLYNRLVTEYAADDSNIKFVDCPVTSTNAHLHQGLGVRTIPFGHVYHPEAGLVEERRISRKYISDFNKVLRSYKDGARIILDDECLSPYKKDLKA